MIKAHSIVLVIVGMSTLVLGQTQGCDLNVLLSALRPGTSALSDDSSLSDDDSQSPADDLGNSQEKILVAVLRSTGAMHGQAKYRELAGRMRLTVEVEDAAPGAVFNIIVNGVEIGQLVVGSLGKGEIEFDTHVEPYHRPWPAKFGNGLTGGATVAAGDMQGTLQGV